MSPLLRFPFRIVLAVGFLSVASNLPLFGEESIVALGKVYNNGVLTSSASPIGATVTSSIGGTGTYTLTFTSAGAFAGAVEEDFTIETTIDSLSSGDLACYAEVSSLTADALSVKVRVSDIDQITPPDVGVATNSYFVFVVRRIGALTNGKPFSSRHLFAVGQVLGTGALASGFGVGGVTITSGRGGEGSYYLRIAKTGAFTTDHSSHYILLVSPRHLGFPDGAVRGGVFNATGDDYVDFYVHTDDEQQDPPSNSPVPADMTFTFAVYRTSWDESPALPNSNLLAAVATVQGSNGALVAGRTTFPGASMSSQRTSTGRYDIFITSPGAFAGDDDSSFCPIVNLNAATSSINDDLGRARVIVLSANQIRIDVNVDDIQQPNDADGIPADSDFSVTVYDASPTLRHDLQIGKKAKLSSVKGKGVFNASGAGQVLTLRLAGRSRQSAFFRSVQTGRSIDDLRIKSGKLPSLIVSQLLVTSAPRRNITAAAKTGLTVSKELHTGQTVAFQAKFRYRSLTKRPRKTFRLQTISGYQPANIDTNRVQLKPI